jgi:hypothetical protein
VHQPGAGGRDKSTGRHLSLSAATVIAALIAALGSFIGGAFAGPHVGIVIAQPTVTITVNAPHTATPTASQGGGGTTRTSPGQQLFSKNNVQLTQGFQLSLIDPTLRPFSYSGTCVGDLYVCSNQGAWVASSGQLSVYDGSADFSQCQADTNYVSGDANSNRQSLVGKTLCVTKGHRVAVCYVTDDTTQVNNTPAPGLTMNIKVYASP